MCPKSVRRENGKPFVKKNSAANYANYAKKKGAASDPVFFA